MEQEIGGRLRRERKKGERDRKMEGVIEEKNDREKGEEPQRREEIKTGLEKMKGGEEAKARNGAEVNL